MISDLVQLTIEGTIIDYYDLIGDPFIDKCSFCNNYKRIVAQNCWNIPMLCKECWKLFYGKGETHELHKLRIEYQRRLMSRKNLFIRGNL